MFNPEKLLNKVISEMAGSTSLLPSGNKNKKKKKRKAKGLSDSLVSNLSSGKGLMAAIALGVGAYTIAQGSKSSAQATVKNIQTPPVPSPGGSSSPPPLPGQVPVSPTVPTSTASLPVNEKEKRNELAIRFIQVMIAAAWADGEIDATEETQILNKLQGQQLDSEEKAFLLGEIHAPKTITQLCEEINDPRIAQTMYSLAVATLVIDTQVEREWLDQLARELSISKDMQGFIEEDL
jgi:uncharacterized membrane protein YebE (DUF533 family)